MQAKHSPRRQSAPDLSENKATTRAYAIDVLRGLAIIGMVFSGYIAWNPDLSPAWFHAQVPPPLFRFDPSVAGITWVDLVFPFFLFSMGAAFPFSLGRKLDKGTPKRDIAGGILKRGILLAFFAIVLGNAGLWSLDDTLHRLPASALLTLCIWGAFFAMFIRLPRLSARQNKILNGAGLIVLAGFLLLYRALGVAVSMHNVDIIILILAVAVVAGSFVWWLTRRSLLLRLGIIALIVAFKIGASVDGSWPQAVWNAMQLFHTDSFQYLCLVLPGSIAGDLIARRLAQKTTPRQLNRPRRIYAATAVISLLFLCNMWGLFTRHLTTNIILTVLLGSIALWLLYRPRTADERLLARLFTTGFFWLLLGLLFEPFEGGIKKDPATLSYLFVTAGLASHILMITTVLLDHARLKAGFLIRCGQNPMIAYTAGGYVIMPLLTLLSLAIPIPWLFGHCSPVTAILRGVVITGLMMCLTSFFSKRKLFWRT